jgi:hypothetical protein
MGNAFEKITTDVEHESYPKDEPEVRRAAILALAEEGWSRAQAIAEGREVTEAWSADRRTAEIEQIASRIMSALGKDAFRSPKAELVAEALLHINDRFAEQAAGSPDVFEAFLSAVRWGIEGGVDGDDEDYPSED